MENNSSQRHGFVSFWLWLSVIASAVMLIYTLYISYTLSLVFSSDVFTIHTIWPCVAAFCTLGGYLLLLCWKRRGFLVLLTVELCTVINNLFVASQVDPAEITAIFSIQSFIAPMVRMLVLFLILQIKKNGVSYWEAMSSDVQSQPVAPQPPQLPQQLQQPKPPQQQYAPGPYCPQCGSRNLETSKFCTECGTALKSSISPVAPPPPPQPVAPPPPVLLTSPVSSCLDTEVSSEHPKGSTSNNSKRNGKWWVLIMILLLGGVGLYFLLNTGEQASENDAVQMQTSGNHEGHEWVDLGLPSGLKWATCNVGAANPEDSGNYYAWGETKTKSEYWDSIADGKNWGDFSGNSTRDAAQADWGGFWRTPTRMEFQELIDYCDWEWTTEDGNYGYNVTGPNGMSIFFPAAGYRHMDRLYNNTKRDCISYWTSTPSMSDNSYAYRLDNDNGNIIIDAEWNERSNGSSIRPVMNECLPIVEDMSSEEYAPVEEIAEVECEYFEESDDVYFNDGVLYALGEEYPMSYVEGVWIDEETEIDSFYIGCYEVTQALWEAVMGTDVYEQRDMTNPSWSLRGVGRDYPMYYVNYHEAKDFCAKLNEYTDMMFYLPSELEWEYAASGGPNNDHYIYSGSDDVNSVAWYKGNSNDLTHEVGSKYPNSLGIYDMSGNVREWCDGWDGSKRALRGGGWYNDAESNSITARYSDKPQIRDNNYGFRICLEI